MERKHGVWDLLLTILAVNNLCVPLALAETKVNVTLVKTPQDKVQSKTPNDDIGSFRSHSIYQDQLATSNADKTNRLGRHVLALAAPTKGEAFFRHNILHVIDFQRMYANKIIQGGQENVVIFVDPTLIKLYTNARHAADYTGNKYIFESDPVAKDIIVAQPLIHGLFLRDFAPIHAERPIKFQYKPLELPRYEVTNITKAFEAMSESTGMNEILQHVSQLVVDGDNVVDNGRDTAILSSRVIYDNEHRFSRDDINLMLADGLGMKRIIILSELIGEELGHAGRMGSFLDEQTFIVAELDEKERTRLKEQIENAYKGAEIVGTSSEATPPSIISLRNYYDERQWDGLPAACGQYINIVVTDTSVYVPQYSRDPQNRQAGLTSEVDRLVVDTIRSHMPSSKTLVPVQIPDSVCRLGGALRRMTWQLKGQLGDWLVTYAASNSNNVSQ